MRIFTNLLGILVFFCQYFEIIKNKFQFNGLLGFFGYYNIFGISSLFLANYFIKQIKLFFIKKNILITKTLLINLFFLMMSLSIIIRFNLLGYRLLIGIAPFIVLAIYQSDFVQEALFAKIPKSKNLKFILLAIILAITLIFNIAFIITKKNSFQKIDEIEHYTLKKIYEFNAKNILSSIGYFKLSHNMPLFFLYPRDNSFLIIWNPDYFCEDLYNYHQHNIDFDIIFFEHDPRKNCLFIEKNFILEEENEFGFTFIRNKIYQKK
jgi:hypothetical protein